MANTPKVLLPSARIVLGEDITEKGIMICVKPADAKAYKGVDTATYICVGVNDTVGSADESIVVKGGIYGLDNGDSITDAHIGTVVYVQDEHTVKKAISANKVVAGLVVDVDANFVWVDSSPAAMVAARAKAVADAAFTLASA